jgi:hypothetical protein
VCFLQGDPGCSVPLSAAAKGMSSFVAVAADQQGVCRPTSASHPSFLALQRFLQQLMHHQVGLLDPGCFLHRR